MVEWLASSKMKEEMSHAEPSEKKDDGGTPELAHNLSVN
jgi:hypothetical protein